MGFIVCVYTMLCGAPCELYATGLGNGFGNATLSRSTLSRPSIGFEGAEVRAPFTFPPKKNMCFLVC